MSTMDTYKDVAGDRLIHCDGDILHAPGQCEYCDQYGADLQALRIELGIAFTGMTPQPGQLPCPSAERRTAEQAHRWPGNQPQKIGDTSRRYDTYFGVAEPIGWREEHNWFQRFVLWLRGVEHCNDREGQRRRG